jgi:cell wall-associated NlpC family hydrolase
LTARTLFPRVALLGFALSLTATAVAQTNNPDDRPRYAVHNTASVKAKDIDTASDPADVETNKRAPAKLAKAVSLDQRFQEQLLAAIESHLGTPYHFNRTGPESFDCSGLVWRAFQDAGIDFQRGPARSYWATFSAPAEGEQFKFGNLVFFSGLSHVGIVVDEKGFYHSARHGGVMYSPFNDYWLSRIDGFRRVPIDGMQIMAADKRQAKPTATVPMTDDVSPR